MDGLRVSLTFGIQVGQQPYAKPSLDANPPVLRIGDGSAGGHQADGILDEVALFNAPLEAEDIQAIMEKGLEAATGFSAAVSPQGKLPLVWARLKR